MGSQSRLQVWVRCATAAFLGAATLSIDAPHASAQTSPATRAIGYLANVQDQYHGAFDVYRDADAAGNHFATRVMVGSAPPMEERFYDSANCGLTCIKATFVASSSDVWGGWYFMNGILEGSDNAPKPNWGTYPNAGVDLRGAKTLSFRARGATGGERVEFFAFGIGREPTTGNPTSPYPDSSRKVSLGFVTLTTGWSQYRIDVTQADLSYVLGGFGWVTSAPENSGRNITFYVDDIGYDLPRLADPRFLVSYKTIESGHSFDRVTANTAFVYDNAVALIAMVSAGDLSRARSIADALVYAVDHDRYYTDGRLRNAYQAGDLKLPPGWVPNGRAATVRMPGWYDAAGSHWYEDKYNVSTTTGNVAWAMLALLRYYDRAGGAAYLTAAKRLGNWVEANTRDERGPGGYTGGYEGWEPSPDKVYWKSTEHALDLMAAFTRLHEITANPVWAERSGHARDFVLAMWDAPGGKFLTGTTDDGVTRVQTPIPLDAQAWTVLALADAPPYYGGLDFAETHHRVGNGYDFNEDRDGIWWEGTAQMATAYRKSGNQVRRDGALAALEAAQQPSGAMPASDRIISTGFYFPTGDPWLYFPRAHVGATSWFVLAETGANPFAPILPTTPSSAGLTLSPSIGPPGTKTIARGTKFGAQEIVDVSLDGAVVGNVTTGSTGTFARFDLTIPLAARPGNHAVVARGRTSGRSAEAAFTVRTNWPQFHGEPQHRGYNSTENVLNPDNVSNLGLAWTGPGGGGASSPAVSDGVVYVGGVGGALYAYPASCGGSGATCSPLWTGDAGGEILGFSPAVGEGHVFIAPPLSFRLSAFPTTCATAGGTCVPAWTASFNVPINSTPTVADGVVYLAARETLYAFPARCGQGGTSCSPLWTATVGGVISSVPAVAKGKVYVGAYDGKVYAFQVNCGSGGATCSPLWTGATGGPIFRSSPAVADGVVYVGSEDRRLYAFNATCGTGGAVCQPHWTGPTGAKINSSPAVANGVVYVGSNDGSLYAFRVGCGKKGGTCSPLWRGQTGGMLHSSPAVANGVVYIGSVDGRIYGFPADCGSAGGGCAPRWSYPTSDSVSSSPAVADGRVYVSASTGLLALSLHGS